MYICICNGVTDRDIRNAAASGCTTMRELKRDLGVATECGKMRFVRKGSFGRCQGLLLLQQ